MPVKRLLGCYASDFRKFSKEELIASIAASAGRTILAENDVAIQPMSRGVTNAEYVAAFGADLILLNLFDFERCSVLGIDIDSGPDVIWRLKELTGLPVGVNLEPVDENADATEKLLSISSGRTASDTNLARAAEMGFDFICLTGNPSTGVTNSQITHAVARAKTLFGGMIIAGKMHGAGVNEPVIDKETITSFADAGADVILIPVAGTIPGMSEAEMYELVRFAHAQNKLVLGAIGTTQEGSDTGTIRELALTSKRVGCDIHHIGDGGPSGHADPENIFQLSVAVRGKRHTYFRMAVSSSR